MAQQIINTGTGPDTGDGDDLYVAFTKVNQNFNALWQFGPVDSNVQIANNQISITNTNGNLILNPQGVGVVQVNNSILPRFHNTFSLGTDNLRFRSAYFGTGGVEINGNLTLNGSFFGNINFGNTIVANLQGNVLSANGNTVLNQQSRALDVFTANVSNLLRAGNILPLANGIYSLGSTDLQWKDLYLSGNTLYIANIGLTADQGELLWGGNLVVTQTANNITIPGNLVANTVSANLQIVAPAANISGNVIAGNVLTNNLLYANGQPYVFGGIPGGNNTEIQFNSNGSFGGSSAFAFDQSSNTVTLSGNITAGNVNAAQVHANANVTAPQLIANVANGTAPLLVNSQTLVANLNADLLDGFNSATANTGNTIALRNADGNLAANYFIGNGAFLTGIDTSLIANGNSNVSVAANGNVTISVAGNSAVAVFTGTGANINGYANVTGNVTAGNVSATDVSGNTLGGTLTTADQPNITQVGTLSALTVAGNTTVGNLTVNGNLVYINVETLSVQDPIIQLQVSNNGQPPVSNTGFDVGTALNYFDSQARVAFMGWDVSNAEFGFGSRTTITNEVVAFDSYGNLRANEYLGTSANLAANIIAGGILTDNIFYANGQPYVFGGIPGGTNSAIQFNDNGVFGGSASLTFDSSVSNLVLSGNIDVTGGIGGTLTTAYQPNITQVGTLIGLSVTGNIGAGNLGLADGLTAGGIYAAENYSSSIGSFGTRGQYLASDGNGKTYWASHFYVGDGADIDFATLNYGDILFYLDAETGLQRLYMWVTDGVSDYFYDFLPPEF